MTTAGVRWKAVVAMAVLACASACAPATMRLSQFEHVESVSPVHGPERLALRPGDVLIVRRWSPGYQEFTESGRQGLSPANVVLRVPLRFVDPAGRLRGYERELLLDVLATNRSERAAWSDSAATEGESRRNDAQRANDLRSLEVPLWNALVQNLVGYELKPDPTWHHDPATMQIAVSYPALARVLHTRNLAYLLNAEAVLELTTLPQSKPVALGAPPAAEDSLLDLFGLRQPFSSPEQALAGRKDYNTHANSRFYWEGNFQPALFAFESVELSGARVAGGGEESNWTLREWAHSGICSSDRSDAAILSFRLRRTPRRFVLMDGNPTHKVVVTRVGGRATRELQVGSRRWTRGTSSLARDALDLLTMRDVADVEWRGNAQPDDHCRIAPRGGSL